MLRPLHPRLARLGSRLVAERGFAVPTVLVAMVAAFGLASAGVVASVTSQGGSVRDQNTKAALGAAEAGVANALLRFNRVATSSASNSCAPVDGTAAATGGWCPEPVVGSIDRGGYAYWVRPTQTELQIVSTGTVDGVSRRVQVNARSDSGNTQGTRPFGLASVVGLDSIQLMNNAAIEADVATNGSIGLDGPNSQLACAYAGVGIGKGFSPDTGSATCTPTEAEVSLPPVNPGDVMTNNSNGHICTAHPMQGQECTLAAWNPDTKRLNLDRGASLTLGAAGGEFNYAFCKVTLNSNAYIYVAAGAKVRMYFGAPEECNNESQPLVLHAGSKIQPTGADPSDLAILVVGSETRSTSVILNSEAIGFDCDQSFVLYAPRTNVTLNSNSTICGAVGAKTILVNSGAKIVSSSTASEFELPNTEEHYSIGYGPVSFVECSASPPTPPSPPDAGC